MRASGSPVVDLGYTKEEFKGTLLGLVLAVALLGLDLRFSGVGLIPESEAPLVTASAGPPAAREGESTLALSRGALETDPP